MIKFNNYPEYADYIQKIHPTKVYTQAEVDELSPDNIDCGAFWEEAVVKFRENAYAGSLFNPKTDEPLRVNTINHFNQTLHESMNSYSRLFEIKRMGLLPEGQKMNVLEIGGGVGGNYNWLTKNCGMPIGEYLNIDVYQPEESLIKDKTLLFNGSNFDMLPTENKYDFVFCLNVFQHLSIKQILGYLNYIKQIVSENHVIVFNMQTDSSGKINGPKGSYTYHYGQLTLLFPSNIWLSSLQREGFIVQSVTSRADGYLCVTLRYEKPKMESTSPKIII